MRLGDLDALHHELVVEMVKCIRMSEENKGTMAERVLNKVDEANTIDAVPVVRCRDCMRGCKSKLDKDAVWCSWFVVETRPDGFCSYGKRKENNND